MFSRAKALVALVAFFIALSGGEILSSRPFVYGVTVRETDEWIFNVNLRLNASVVNEFLPVPLTADTYNSTAWVCFFLGQIEKIEVPFAGGWLPLSMSPTWVMKVYVPVLRSGTNHTGYMLLSMDFQHSITGWVQALGCESTQEGVRCSEAASLAASFANLNASLLGDDGVEVNMNFDRSGTSGVDQEFVRWLVTRPFVYEAGKNGVPTEAPEERGYPANFRGAATMRANSFSSNLLSTRFPTLAAAERSQGVCSAAGECFTSPFLEFVDHSGEPI